MTLSKREKVLALSVGGLGVVMLGTMMVGLIVNPIRNHYKARESAEERIVLGEGNLVKARMAQKKMEDWRPRSLPNDAQGLYDALLIEWGKATFPFEVKTAARAAAKAAAPSGTRPGAARQTFRVSDYTLRYTLDGQGSAKQLVDFLFKFYTSGYLHQIHSMDIKPAEKPPTDLHVTLIVEILAIPDPPGTPARPAALPNVPPPTKKPEATLVVYEQDIATRNPFAPFTPPEPPPKKEIVVPPPKFDVSKYAVVTAIVTEDGMPEAWIKDRTTDQILRLHVGDKIALGTFKGKVSWIGEREVDFIIDGGTDPIRVGLNEPLKKTAETGVGPGGSPPGSADAKSPAVAFAEKGKAGEADASKDARDRGGPFGARSGRSRQKGGFKKKQADEEKSEK